MIDSIARNCAESHGTQPGAELTSFTVPDCVPGTRGSALEYSVYNPTEAAASNILALSVGILRDSEYQPKTSLKDCHSSGFSMCLVS